MPSGLLSECCIPAGWISASKGTGKVQQHQCPEGPTAGVKRDSQHTGYLPHITRALSSSAQLQPGEQLLRIPQQ